MDRPHDRTPDLPIPTNLRDSRWVDPAWLATLPDSIARLTTKWGLELDPPFEPGGTVSWVAPGRTRRGDDVVLKVGIVGPEAVAEAQGLRDWDGNGAVRLLAVEERGDEVALLLERVVPGERLKLRPELEQDLVIADLVRRLHTATPTPEAYPTLTAMCDLWASEYQPATGDAALDPGLVRTGLELFTELPRTAARDVLLVTDLHADNVLSAAREPWLLIDPKPHLGDPTYEPLQHMLNCQRLQADPEALIMRIADLFELDRDRLRLWTFVRCVQQSPHWTELAPVARTLAP